MEPLRIIFMGTAELACPSLAALVRAPGFTVAGVVTQPDRPKGRELKLQPPPVKIEALRWDLPVLQPERARDESFIQTLHALDPDLIVVAAYGQILRPVVLELPRFGCLNVHASILPEYRGAAPIQWAILNGETETGVTIMKMNAGLDTGDILTQTKTPIVPADNARTVHDRLARLGADLLVRTIRDYLAGKIAPRPQSGEAASYARKLTKEDGRIDWTQPALAIWNRVRAFNPWPGAFTTHKAQPKSFLLKIWQAETAVQFSGDPGEIVQADQSGITVACGQGALRILSLQPAGGRVMAAQEFLAGHPLGAGDRLA
jgi:methionyl-tRNA formyltransferase